MPDKRRRRVSAALLATMLATSSCSSLGQPSDADIINAILVATVAPGKPICIDLGTYGEPLAVFRTMIAAPDPARVPLVWTRPLPLLGDISLSGRQLVDTELRGDQIVLPEPRNSRADRLPLTSQVSLNALAHEGSLMVASSDVDVPANSTAPASRVRWWVLNRLDSRCGPIYTFSKPVIFRDTGFVSVTAGHWGSTYAFRKTSGRWTAIAKWSTWLY